MTLRGIDVSHWQATTPSLTGLSFLIAKATEGTTRDPAFGMHIANARRAGLIPGAYHFARDDVQIAAQVNAFLAATADVPWIAFDVEGPHAWSLAQTRQAVALVHEAGREVGLYMSESAFYEANQDWDWVANWSHEPARHYDVWQHRGSPLDLDRFEGTLAELRTLAGMEDPMIVISNGAPALVDLALGRQLYDSAGAPLVKVSSGGVKTGILSPFEAALPNLRARAVVVVTGGRHVLAFVRSTEANVRPVPPPPPADCSAVEHELETATSRIVKAITDLGGTP